jgi:hypothetical protein
LSRGQSQKIVATEGESGRKLCRVRPSFSRCG